MAKSFDRAQCEARLRACDKRLAAEPSVNARYHRAGLLVLLGRLEEARADYLTVLKDAPDHLGALNDLGTLLHGQGFVSAARTCYAEAVAQHPDAVAPRVNLANLLLDASEIAAAREHYAQALLQDPDHAEAHQGMARVLAELGENERAAEHRAIGFRGRALVERPYRGEGKGVPMLVLVASAGGNIPARFLIDDRVFRAIVVVADFFAANAPLPSHALVFNTIGDADLASDALKAAIHLLKRSTAPVINPPQHVLDSGRAENARRLAAIPGVIAPRIAVFPRAELEKETALAMLVAEGFRFPLLLRRPGFHAGQHFVKIAEPGGFAAALATLPGAELTAIEFLDVRSTDGMVRKYRVMLIDGKIYPMHLAVSFDWKVHYFTSAMAERPDHRAEEAAFLADMIQAIGRDAVAALENIGKVLGLDYGGIDFGVTRKGEVVLFEANATMVVNPPEPDPRWDYRRAPVERILAAAKAMLRRRAGLDAEPAQ